jgi:hypothetical protein
MRIPNPLPSSVSVYIMSEDSPRGRVLNRFFKIGLSTKPKIRASNVGGKVYWRREFPHYFTALYVEQTMIQLVETSGYRRITSDDWFEIDEDAVKVVIEITKELISQLSKWEWNNVLPWCDLLHSEGPAAEYVKANRGMVEKYERPREATVSFGWE